MIDRSELVTWTTSAAIIPQVEYVVLTTCSLLRKNFFGFLTLIWEVLCVGSKRDDSINQA